MLRRKIGNRPSGAATYNTFNLCRHLTTARTHRLFRAEAFAAWRGAAGVAA